MAPAPLRWAVLGHTDGASRLRSTCLLTRQGYPSVGTCPVPRDTEGVSHRHLQLTFPPERVTEPVIYEIITRFSVVPSIRRAAIENHVGWMVLDLSGDDASLDAATGYLESCGVDVSVAEGDVIAG